MRNSDCGVIKIVHSQANSHWQVTGRLLHGLFDDDYRLIIEWQLEVTVFKKACSKVYNIYFPLSPSSHHIDIPVHVAYEIVNRNFQECNAPTQNTNEILFYLAFRFANGNFHETVWLVVHNDKLKTELNFIISFVVNNWSDFPGATGTGCVLAV